MPDSHAIHSHHMHALNPRAIPAAAGIGLLAAALMLVFISAY
jgi:hypothetical protein